VTIAITSFLPPPAPPDEAAALDDVALEPEPHAARVMAPTAIHAEIFNAFMGILLLEYSSGSGPGHHAMAGTIP
jgi:hypothetical protein